ncbi:hypothetical protein E2N92_06755 [Methanofollis formosanus]|uniref:Yip1 domain-containing protein n=1 Tax=Methanofollis formosanus TaxID=299308 RepID=A0A8G1A313_9EURY|nr:YIP1 family protein [Methanofollis formosanus]QYZ79152.1 hypothetical protein E2N92_06755 [Methanofollis formosanus]
MSEDLPIKNIFTGPGRLFDQLRIKSLQEDLLFFFTVVLAVSILSTLRTLLMYPVHEPTAPYLIGGMLFGAFGPLQSMITWAVILLSVSLIEHFFLLFVDEHQGFERTMKSAIYALFPTVLFWWAAVILKIPYAGLLLLLCFTLITYSGIRKFHEKSKDRAAFVSLATSAVLLILFSRWISVPGFGLWL